MAITWDQARAKIRGDLWRTGTAGVPDDVCDRALHASILELESARRWLWLENISRTVELTEDKDRIQVPSDLSTIQSLTYIDISGRLDSPLSLLPVPRIRTLADATTAGAPSAYALSGNEVFFDTLAPEGSKFELVYTARTTEDLAAAVSDGDDNVTLQAYQHIVLKGACAEVAQSYLRNDAEFARQRAAFERGRERLETVDDEARGDLYGGLIVPDDGYDVMARGYVIPTEYR